MPELNLNTVSVSDALAYVRGLPTGSIDLIFTSPPYFGSVRDYQVDGQLGMEVEVSDYVDALCEILMECWRVLKDSGSLFLNLGDKYGRGRRGLDPKDALRGTGYNRFSKAPVSHHKGITPEKQLLGIPQRVAFRLQELGWIWRGDAPWIKNNGYGPTVFDRPVTSHEYIMQFSKSLRYYYDADAVRTDQQAASKARTLRHRLSHKYADEAIPAGMRQSIYQKIAEGGGGANSLEEAAEKGLINAIGRHRRTTEPFFETIEDTIADVEETLAQLIAMQETGCAFEGDVLLAVQAGTGASTKRDRARSVKHYAPFPEKIVRGIMAAACPPDGVVLDPFMGSGTTAVVAVKLGRNFLGCDLNPDFVQLTMDKVADTVADIDLEIEEEIAAIEEEIVSHSLDTLPLVQYIEAVKSGEIDIYGR
jgi:DNA modification methylase